MYFSVEEIVKIVPWYMKLESPTKVQHTYRKHFMKDAPSKPAIYKLVNKFGEVGTVCNLNAQNAVHHCNWL